MGFASVAQGLQAHYRGERDKDKKYSTDLKSAEEKRLRDRREELEQLRTQIDTERLRLEETKRLAAEAEEKLKDVQKRYDARNSAAAKTKRKLEAELRSVEFAELRFAIEQRRAGLKKQTEALKAGRLHEEPAGFEDADVLPLHPEQ